MANQRLPGIYFSVRDGGLTPAVTEPSTDRLLIIGNALDGPINVPTVITSLSDAEDIFGPLIYKDGYLNPNTSTADGSIAGNTLLKAAYEALIGGAGNIALVRVGGTTATATETFNVSGSISAVAPGRIYNGVQVISSSGSSGYNITIVQPVAKGGTINYTFASSVLLGNAINTINNDNRNRSVFISIPPSLFSSAITVLSVGTATLANGTNGTNAVGEDYYTSKTGYYTKLTETYGTFDTLVTTVFDIAHLAGIYADDQVNDSGATTTTTVAQAFAEFLHRASKEGTPCHGVIGLRPTGLKSPADLTTLATNNYLNTSSGFYNASSRWIKFGYFMNAGFTYSDPDTLENIDIGRYLSVVAGPDLLLQSKELGYYLENGAAVYAGMITSLPPQFATTNKPLGVKSIWGSFTKTIHEQLNQGVGRDPAARNTGSGAYVTFKFSEQIGRPMVIADNTASSRDSDYRTLQVLRIVNLASSEARKVLLPFIGNPNSIEARTAMKTQLNAALQRLVDVGALLGGDGNGFNFSISSDPVAAFLGQVTVYLFLRPAFQIKTIDVVVSVGS